MKVYSATIAILFMAASLSLLLSQQPLSKFRSSQALSYQYSSSSVVAKQENGHHGIPPENVVIVMADNRWNLPPNHTIHLSAAINQAYAHHRGHRFLACDSEKDPWLKDCLGGPSSVCKLYCVQHAMVDMENVDLVVFLDSDAIFRNFSQGIDEFVGQHTHRSRNETALNAADTVGTAATTRGTSNGGVDLVVPSDCPDYQFNSGILVWYNSESAQGMLQEWIRRCRKRRYRRFPWEQQALKDWYNKPNSTIAWPRLASIPYGPETWHVGSCAREAYISPDFIAHITGRWPRYWREWTMVDTIQELCPLAADNTTLRMEQCETLRATIQQGDHQR